MRTIVIDACVVVKWYSRESDSDQAISLLSNENLEFIAPDILLPEVVNTLLKHTRLRGLQRHVVDRAVADILAISPGLVSSTELIVRAVEIAQELKHPVYDCLYIALAERRSLPFVTAEFAERCRRRLGLPHNQLALLTEFVP